MSLHWAIRLRKRLDGAARTVSDPVRVTRETTFLAAQSAALLCTDERTEPIAAAIVDLCTLADRVLAGREALLWALSEADTLPYDAVSIQLAAILDCIGGPDE